jgi:peroxiredoxin Q/BCP
MAENRAVQVGDTAPNFTLQSTAGKSVSLADFRGQTEVVLFFYPKDGSPFCSIEACSFRDSYEAFREEGAEVIGVSSDSPESHQDFANRLRLPYLLLSDPKGEVRTRYGVPRTIGLFDGRVTYVIDRNGIVRHIFSSQLQPGRHVSEALAVLRTLRSSGTTQGV